MSPVASEASLEALEFPAALALLAAQAATDLGRDRVAALRPAIEVADLEARRAAFADVGRLLAAGGSLVPSFEEPLAPILVDLAQGGERLAGRELVRLAAMARSAADIRQRIASAGDPPLVSLAGRFAHGPDPAPFATRVERTLDRRGEVREDASPRLGELRRAIRGLRDRLYRELGAQRGRLGAELAEETIPLRNNRLVLVADAGARGRLSGLFHGRSASGKSYYFEPFETVELNNQLQQSAEDEAEEKRRILLELVAHARREHAVLEAAAECVASIDLFQASHRFADAAGARLAERGDRLTLAAARHPLLDPRLAALRESALGTAGHREAAVPLDLELGSPRARVLVITGPNAGGKTVALKTTGLLAALHQSGLPVPAGPGTKFPWFERIVATVGDEQDLLADRSTFSGRLVRLREAWDAAGPGRLVLLDELGSGTDPEEGAALSEALLETLVERGALGIVTTHLIRLAATALELEGAACAAMEFDTVSGQPTYRLQPGPPGGSEAIALARRLGLPAAWLERAEAKLGAEHRDLRRLLAELEAARDETRAARARLDVETEDAAKLRQRLERELEALAQERRSTGARLKSDLEHFRRETRARLESEAARVREEFEAGRRHGLAAAAVERLFTAAPELPVEEPAAGPLEIGQRVRHRALGWKGALERVDGARAEVRVRGKKVACRLADLVADTGGATEKEAASSPRGAVVVARARESEEGMRELNLIGMRAEPALDTIDRFLDQALLEAGAEIRLIHGHGTGRLRDAIRAHLRRHPAVSAHRAGAPNEGGNGATVVTLRRDG